MIRLLILFVLFPVAVFSQTLRQGVVDSINAAAMNNEPALSKILGNKPGTKLDHVAVSDTGDYVTIVMRLRVPIIHTIAALPPGALVGIKTDELGVVDLPTVALPPLPSPAAEADITKTLPLGGLANIKVALLVVDSFGLANLPPLPAAVEEVGKIIALSPLPLVRIKTRDIVVSGVNTMGPPPLPAPVAEADLKTTLPIQRLVGIKARDFAAGRFAIIPVPPLPPLLEEVGAITALAVQPPIKVKVSEIILAKALVIPPMAIPHRLVEPVMPVAGLHLSDEGYSLLEKLEGFSPELYTLKDGGFTIGFGFFVPYGEMSKWNDGVTMEEAEQMIRQKVPAYEDQVKQYINVPVSQNEFDALTMLAYNLGGFSKATSIVNDINSLADFDKLQRDWNRFVHSKAPNVTKGLMNRRKDELGVKKYADYQPERKIQVLKLRK
jgi:GH24 family phage-related lysozyme (muramidase)